MAPQTRPRARSSVEHLFDLVESLEEDQLRSFLEEINSTPDTNIDVSSGVAYFEEQRRLQAHQKQQHLLRPTPSFLNAPPEPKDWPRQKPRPVSGSQWRQSMRIVSAPYARHQHQQSQNNNSIGGNEPVSPPLTASPPGSPPTMAPRRSVTAPVGKIEVRVESRQVEEPSPVSPPRHMLDGDDDQDDQDSRPTFEAFHFGVDGTADDSSRLAHTQRNHSAPSSSSSTAEQSRPVSPAQQQPQPTRHEAITPPPEPESRQLPAFSRLGTMPPLHHAPLSFDTAPVRPSTSAGPLAPRAFRRVSRPVFLSPTEGGAEELAGRLSAFLFGGGAAAAGAVAAKQRHSTLLFGGSQGQESGRRGSVVMEEMLKEPGMPRGRGEGDGVPVSGIFEVLTKG